jgi:hypothetical protein
LVNKGLHKKGAKHPWHMQTFKKTKLELTGQAKAGIHNIQRLTNTHRFKLLNKGIYLEKP